MAIEQGSMREVINNIYQVLINDEILLRLLWYKPKRETGKDPLDGIEPLTDPPTLPHVKDMATYWDIVDERVMLAEKVNDLVEKPICRLYISPGRRRGLFNNYLLASQEIVISVYVHEDYEVDMRSAWISDRINELIVLEYVKGTMNKRFEFVAGNARVAPIQYSKFELIFEYTTSKK